jgi:esterase/lipase superfamily enzyme
MKSEKFTLECKDLQKSFDVVVYGDAGRPVVVFPEGNSSFVSWQDAGMIDGLSALIEGGEAQLFCVDSADDLGWYARHAFVDYRLENIEAYLAFVKDVLVPFVEKIAASAEPPVALGAGMGAMNAALVVLRNPELFGGVLALSGTYDARWFVEDGLDEGWLAVSAVDVVRSLSPRGKAHAALKELPLAFVCGQEASETGIETQRDLSRAFEEQGIDATFEYWGYDVSHAWHWWLEETRQLLPAVLKVGGLEERRLTADLSYAEVEAEHAREVLAGEKEGLASARDALKIAVADVADTAKRVVQEKSVVEKCRAVEQEMAEKAAKLWAERDRVAALLAEAEAKAREAQDRADAASRARADAEWVAGEAKAAAEHAVQNKAAAEGAVADHEAAVAAAKDVKQSTAASLDAVKAAFEAERAAVRKAVKEASAKKSAAKKPAAKAAAKPAAKTAAKTATKKPATKKPATKKSSSGKSASSATRSK